MLLATSASTRSSRLLSTTASKHERIDNDILQQPAIKIVEVSPRDGLQNEPPPIVSVKDKIEFISKLDNAGCSNIEVGALVSPRLVPQMSGSSDILKALREKEHEKELLDTKVSRRPTYSVLVPNLEGLQHALVSGRGVIDEIAIFSATSDEFTKRNINATIDESIERFQVVIDHIQQDFDNGSNKPPVVRGYVSTVIACPYQGMIEPKQVAHVVERMLDLGCHEVSLGDTTGVGTPLSTRRMLDEVLNVAQPFQLAMHCHDTYGQALANILVGLEKEIYTIDSSVAGLG
ncbi:unnamed protein product [Pseudo-nitzschia multistriata]|nr:unnamed protein product [Pseudo-nitzschia multistriata]